MSWWEDLKNRNEFCVNCTWQQLTLLGGVKVTLCERHEATFEDTLAFDMALRKFVVMPEEAFNGFKEQAPSVPFLFVQFGWYDESESARHVRGSRRSKSALYAPAWVARLKEGTPISSRWLAAAERLQGDPALREAFFTVLDLHGPDNGSVVKMDGGAKYHVGSLRVNGRKVSDARVTGAEIRTGSFAVEDFLRAHVPEAFVERKTPQRGQGSGPRTRGRR